MRIAVICEYSGTVRDAFVKEGHEAISFDLLPSETPGEHYQGDIQELPLEYWKQFDLAVCHPPCTHLAVSGARHFKKKLELNPNIQEDALDLVRYLMNLPIEKIAIENPVSIISSRIRKPDQIVQPWQFGEPFQKTTCLWLKGLPLLKHTKVVDKGEFITFPSGKKMAKWISNQTAKNRSKTFQGIADAMATQWGNDEMLTDHENKPIPMNGEHPAHDYFGMSIDYGETYYITPNEEIVHVLNVDEYFVHVMKCDVVKVEE